MPSRLDLAIREGAVDEALSVERRIPEFDAVHCPVD